MDSINSEFNPVRKSKIKVSPENIIKDAKEDHDQISVLRGIKLIPVKRASSEHDDGKTQLANFNSETTDHKNIIASKRSTVKHKANDDDDYDKETLNVLKRIKIFNSSPKFQLKSNSEVLKELPTDPEFTSFKNHLLRQLYQTVKLDEITIPSYLKATESEVDRILKLAIIQKESHSTILVGPRGGYKSFLLSHTLAKISRKYDNQYITIRLNGYVHSEQTAINGIATQIEQQLRKINASRNNSKKESVDISSGSLTEVFEKILRLLDSATFNTERPSDKRKNKDTSKITVIFIFDEIDTFAGPVRQTLLYNLFDMVEHARIPVCIFGCTTKLNFLDYLEKRVKSRFSQRIINIPQIKTLKEFSETIKESLIVPDSESNAKDRQYTTQWNETITNIIQDDNSQLSKILKTNFETFKSMDRLKYSMVPFIHSSPSFENLLSELHSCNQIIEYETNQRTNDLTGKVRSLSDLELAILISTARAAMKTKDESVNFNFAYAEYEEMIKSLNVRIPTMVHSNSSESKNSIIVDNAIKLWSKKDIKNIWESILSLDLMAEKGNVGLRESAIAVFYASNYQFQGTMAPFDLRLYQMQVTLQELRKIVPRSSIYYPWTQL
ncbi:hypothetical protein TBLA_0J00240 [Henningerozyma blattae CBS 6284]|uniref:Origin recognition complex subunit 4 C-terminal domain-containing protein n=1 Tax=Henningerozyma blattae (strain ATCC 34711 / CBS 6284 / DSM 70876 / NBRC 10599 / NRRL Y-10934 / UCD 77-7) TaxID=1071380 RepID=I2H9H2_HENB6|nr:hypothetical protein TBLA_0J00240 [Tetrapisispora blattae CBS 6284]CCH63024.1 hypothetical protein TBLA_0J00240 [Tetrapisispora blattae CBS 6284]